MTTNVQISKMMHHWLNVGKQKLLFEQILDNGKCPCCGTVDEDQEHLYVCEHPDMRSTLEAGITAIEEAFYNANIPKEFPVHSWTISEASQNPFDHHNDGPVKTLR